MRVPGAQRTLPSKGSAPMSPYLSRLKGAGVQLDYVGIALLALGVGALQVVLDKGQEDDWFGSHFIVTLAVAGQATGPKWIKIAGSLGTRFDQE